MRLDVMVDIETLGNESDSTIFQMAAIAFDIKTGESKSEFNRLVDIELNKNLKVTGSTLKWWLNTDSELLKDLLNEGSRSSEAVLIEFHDWLSDLLHDVGRENVYLWGNGILFDNSMIKNQLENIYHSYPILYKNDRDVRTILELASFKSGMSEQELKDKFNKDVGGVNDHNAINDVIYQINYVTGCFKLLTKGEY